MTYAEFQDGKYMFSVLMTHKKTNERYCFYMNANSIEEAKAKYSAPPWAKEVIFRSNGLNPNYNND